MQTENNKMSLTPMPRLLATMSLPIMLSMLIQALYSIIDSIFVAQLGENALTAVSLAWPIQSVIIAVAVGMATGMNALLSRRLGEGDSARASATGSNGLFLAVLCGVIFALAGSVGSQWFIGQFSDVPEVIAAGANFLTIVCVGSVSVFVAMVAERALQATGKAMYSMVSQITGALINVALAPMLIFGSLGMPAMGVTGAAVATVIAQAASMAVGLGLNRKTNPQIALSMRRHRPDRSVIFDILRVGIPATAQQAIGSFTVMGLNYILGAFGQTGILVLSIYNRLSGFVFMPVFGICNAGIPIIGFNYGARNRERIVSCIRLSMASTAVVMLLGTALFWVFPEPLLLMFNATPALLAAGVPALRIISLGFVFAGVDIIFGNTFQALGNGAYSLIMSVVRQIIVLFPMTWLLARTLGMPYLWAAFPAAEVVSVVLAIALFAHIYRERLAPLGDEATPCPEAEATLLSSGR